MSKPLSLPQIEAALDQHAASSTHEPADTARRTAPARDLSHVQAAEQAATFGAAAIGGRLTRTRAR